MAKKQYTSQEEAKLDEALAVLRSSAAFPFVERRLTELLEFEKDTLMHLQTAQVPIHQGRAQMLSEIIILLNRKPK